MIHYSVVFLLDKAAPDKVLMLKRGAFMKYAPGWYTGPGGKMEPGETFLEGALRELHEETGLTGIALAEFARCVVENDTVIHYYCGFYDGPVPDCDEGDLEWVAADRMLDKNVIPDTALVVAEWQRRDYAAQPVWTLYVRRGLEHDGIHESIIERIVPGLDDFEA